MRRRRNAERAVGTESKEKLVCYHSCLSVSKCLFFSGSRWMNITCCDVSVSRSSILIRTVTNTPNSTSRLSNYESKHLSSSRSKNDRKQ